MSVATTNKHPLDWVNIGYFLLIHLAALFAFLPSNFSWSAIGLALVLHWITGGLGITLGFHRLVSHRSFQAPKWLEYFLIFCGSLACQGGVLDWVGLHRMHHLYSDTEADPHDSNAGFWWSHMGWLLHIIPKRSEVPRFTKDIWDDPVYQFLQNNFVLIQVAFGLLLYALGGWPFVVWGIFVRLAVVFHCTWFVNSATHKFGYVSHESHDHSKNCWWVALVTYGEGWHNNHHAYQYSARHGLQWWEFDMTWMTIRLLEILGLATNVKLEPKSIQ
ncbi:acyl-CoA desaturase [Roseofilum sp. BLCC_M91]|uniref:Acyl-CoA desaturase n=1 Tax=Roseofilum halophilum BLCC-M91 TaxID=3022259 RepID=A0ABT7BQ64_9CYAN|nr:acyl-CoA desaturase [Roseofilum halophilum]MDJ1181329.1 acyl-CoA desaturase [Roseofilum halophilum BLCC-M91]